jgi:hypothetical protein
MLILGLIKPEEAKAFLINEAALSESDAREELERYTYRPLGQAAAYVYGYMTLSDLSERIRLALGAEFNEKAYNEFILSQGPLPLNLMGRSYPGGVYSKVFKRADRDGLSCVRRPGKPLRQLRSAGR